MIPHCGRRNLDRRTKCFCTVERKCSVLGRNFEVNKAVRRFARLDSGIQSVLAEIEGFDPVRD
jgi:hypothetical protein